MNDMTPAARPSDVSPVASVDPAGAAQGIEFALFAPCNESVALLGDFNGWQPLPMTKGADDWWRVTVALPDGDHQYRFRVKSPSQSGPGETFDVLDPYAPSVTSDDHEHAIVRVENGQRIWTDYDDLSAAQNDEPGEVMVFTEQ
jgi:1,4-alpha-glucan branching enzyme